MHKGAVVLAGSLLAFCASALNAADNSKPSLTLNPAGDITLYRAEKLELSVEDAQTHKLLDPAKISWEINDAPAAMLPHQFGKLTVGTTPAASAVYQAPLSKPDPNTLVVRANILGTDPPQSVAANVTIVDEKNWFTMKGDTGMGPQMIAVDLDPESTTRVHAGAFFGLGRQPMEIRILGTRKDKPGEKVLEMMAVPSTAPGTCAWNLKDPHAGISMEVSGKEFSTIDFGVRNLATTDGFTTILPPRPSDPPGMVRGFWSGRMDWVDPYRHFLPHYFQISGHFCVQGLPPVTPPPTPAPTAAPAH